jgi:hypothetical protein
MILALTNPEWCLVIAVALFIAAAALAATTKTYYFVLLAIGLMFFAVAFIVDP